MKKNYLLEVDDSYEMIFQIDATQKSLGLKLNIAALVIGVLIMAIGYIVFFPQGLDIQVDQAILLPLVIFIVALLAYLVIHELVHGLFYKLLTKQKLTFGLSWSCAYCGVPNIYVAKKAALVAVLAPFVLLGIILFVGSLLLYFQTSSDLYPLLCWIIFAMHVGGCAGDLYVAYLLLFRFKGEVYTKDTGPKQEFYQRKGE